jgi:hypothetical protein
MQFTSLYNVTWPSANKSTWRKFLSDINANFGRVNVKPSLGLQHHEDGRRSRGIPPHILNIGTRWQPVVSFTYRPIYPWYPLDRRFGGPKSPSRPCGKECILIDNLKMYVRKLISVQYLPLYQKANVCVPQKDDPIALCTNKCISLYWRGKHRI